jgi:cytochrome c-type biogenesis protein CcmH
VPAAPAAAPVAKARPSRRLVGALTLGVAAIAVAGYLATGSPALIGGPGAAPPEHSAAAAPGGASGAGAGVQELAGMVDKLAARMKERPDDAEGWTMLARSYTVLGRFADRAARVQARGPNCAPTTRACSQTTPTPSRRRSAPSTTPRRSRWFARALKLDPTHPKALALAGTADYDRGDYAAAISKWQALQARVAPDSEFGQQIAASIADAQAKLGGAAPAPRAAAPGRRQRPPRPRRPPRRSPPRPASAARSASIPRSPSRPAPATPSSSSPAPPAAAGCRSRCRRRASPTCPCASSSTTAWRWRRA